MIYFKQKVEFLIRSVRSNGLYIISIHVLRNQVTQKYIAGNLVHLRRNMGKQDESVSRGVGVVEVKSDS